MTTLQSLSLRIDGSGFWNRALSNMLKQSKLSAPLIAVWEV